MEYLISIFVLLVLVLIIWATGRKLLGSRRFDFVSVPENFVFSFGAGFGVVSCLVLFLGVLKLLYVPVVIVSLFALAAMVQPEIKECLRDVSGAFKRLRGVKLDLMSKVLLCMLGAVMLMTLVGALSPSYSNDSMVYHLTDAKYFAKNHTVGLIPENSTNSLWPYLVEMYYTLAMLSNLLPLAGLFHFFLAVASTIGVYAFARRFFSQKTGILSAAIFFLTPAVFTEATHTYVDLGSVFYAFMAFYAFILYLENRTARWAALSGIMCGFGMSVKYFAVITPAILGVWMILMIIFGKGSGARGQWSGKEDELPITHHRSLITFRIRSLVLFCVFTALTSCVWYIRQWIVMGNPFFPFFAGIFGGGGLDPEIVKSISEESIRRSHGMIVSLNSFLTLPWRMTMFPSEFGGEQIGPAFLAIIPGAVLLRDVDEKLKSVSIFALAYICVWFLQYQHMRFFLPAVPFLSVIAAYILSKVVGERTVMSKIIWLVISILLAVSLALAFYHNFNRAKVVLGLESKKDYLAANERSFEVSGSINKDLAPDAKIMVVNEAHTFFLDKPYKREIYWWIFTRYDKKSKNPGEIISSMKADGFSHILYARYPVADKGLGTALSLPELMKDAVFREKYLKLLYTTRPQSKNARGVEYQVYKIKK